ncbi:RNA polymerase II transcriptional coactivator KELP [Humulus lupulus]|uniref:RNA polymerase II transcriptional coactivator KELP n=1 Tax=Humulus lupulus TaxID=3486 RepID=UPI002B4176A6|nr:RNA polymerase II transcriptional coactivator KELP [Humulus lupulus]XP_062074600.1 RNA polymerase II transcriptional coactivator KELP [Humulus lupulus]
MEAEMEEKIQKTVRSILQQSNMDDVTEYKIRKQASDKLHLDLSKPPYKAFVKQVVRSFLEEQQQQEEEKEEAEEEEQERQTGDGEYDDEGNLIVCKLSEKRKVTVQDFRGKTLVSIREYFKKDGKELPTAKGISLTEEQWSAFKKNVPAIEKAISKMESRIM